MTDTRIYLISINGSEKPEDSRLVDASSAAQAQRHVAKKMLPVRVASQRDIARLVAAKVVVEAAGKDEGP